MNKVNSIGPGRLRRLLAWWDERLSPSPDLSARDKILAATTLIGFVVAALLINHWTLHRGMGDTDDALRLVMVRDLLSGQGWYDQAVRRLSPPDGTFMHWSRLLDGALAGCVWLMRLVTDPATAERLVRHFFPLVWIFPGVAAALVIARNLGARSAVAITVPLMLLDLQLYRQFIPGRVDHHDIQIVMTAVSLACATMPANRARWGVLAGLATALGLAIGLEALGFQALIGASYGLALARDRNEAKATAAYGLSLAGASVVLFLAQTPPDRWSLSFCDALALNLTVGLTVAGLGLTLAAAVARRAPSWARIGLLAAVGAAAGIAYLAFQPACIHGPFALMDPRVRPFWFEHIQEVQTLDQMLRLDRFAALLGLITMAMLLAAGVFMAARQWPKPTIPALLIAALMVAADITGSLTWRMQDYVCWVGVPAMGAALSYVAQRWLNDKMVPSIVLAVVLSPTMVNAVVDTASHAFVKPAKPFVQPGIRCFDIRAYPPLARLKPGLVLATQDLGSYILAATPHSVLIAPYHRMSAQLLAVHEAFNAPPNLAEARVRALHADYVVDCPGYPMFLDAGSLGMRLRQGATPAWLDRLSAPKAALTIYAVRPPAPPAS